MTYIEFESPFYKSGKVRKLSFFKKLTINFLSMVLPEANPNYEGRFDDVFKWLIEFDGKGKLITREIGIDEEGNVVMKMPFEKNYGFWLDTNAKMEYFNDNFHTEKINKAKFELKWKEL